MFHNIYARYYKFGLSAIFYPGMLAFSRNRFTFVLVKSWKNGENALKKGWKNGENTPKNGWKNGNLEISGKIAYYPIYMLMFLQPEDIAEPIFRFEAL